MRVSIPYGTIKSPTADYSAMASGMFQFLMVRLKAPLPRSRYILKGVSIPYGTIKRFECGHVDADTEHVSIPYGTIKS